MDEREKIIRLWFEMWLTKRDLGMDEIFTEDVIYTESWGPEYNDLETVKHWFHEWNTRGEVVVWNIKQFFHSENQTIVEWYFKNKVNHGKREEFDGVSLIVWTKDNKIKSLKEFGCNLNHYNPYAHRDRPEFRDEKSRWF
ncbi:MAG: nuclear transport factor 2 family protein [Butyricicoccus pullicaecorum]|nr:nuclear transport factor 2 family protein [Butyricicoccus pullicaecorum]